MPVRLPEALKKLLHDKALAVFGGAMRTLRQSGMLRALRIEDLARAFSLAFALHQLRADLGDKMAVQHRGVAG